MNNKKKEIKNERQKIIDRICKKIKDLNTPLLKTVITGLYESNELNSDIPFELALDELSNRVSKEEFIAFCEAL